MATMIFVNLPVNDLRRSRQFFAALGYSFNEKFSDDKAACLIISESIYAMLLTKPFFKTFTKKQIADANTSTEVLLSLSFDSREDVDAIMKKAIEAGGKEAREPKDHGFMYERSFEDPDGHMWEAFWMDPAFDPEKITSADLEVAQ